MSFDRLKKYSIAKELGGFEISMIYPIFESDFDFFCTSKQENESVATIETLYLQDY